MELFCFRLQVLVFAYIPEYAPPEQTYKYEVDVVVETGAHMLRWAENRPLFWIAWVAVFSKFFNYVP